MIVIIGKKMNNSYLECCGNCEGLIELLGDNFCGPADEKTNPHDWCKKWRFDNKSREYRNNDMF